MSALGPSARRRRTNSDADADEATRLRRSFGVTEDGHARRTPASSGLTGDRVVRGASIITSSRTTRIHRAPVQRMGGFMFGGQEAEKTRVDASNLVAEVEDLVEGRFGGVHNLFMKGQATSGRSQWIDLIWDHVSEEWDLQGVVKSDIGSALDTIKDRHRDQILRQAAQSWVYHRSEPITRYDNEGKVDLKGLLTDADFVLDDADKEVLDALVETEGEFSRVKVAVADDCIELYDAVDDEGVNPVPVVVIMDAHQNKHQNPQLDEFPAYTGGGGSQFASNKGLDWHRGNTVPEVRRLMRGAIEGGHVTTDGVVHATPKVPHSGIVYDLTIQYDVATGKYVGSYHCNPLVSEQ